MPHLIELDASGHFLRNVLPYFSLEVVPLDLKIDRQNNIWVTSPSLDKVTEVSSEGHVLRVLGGKQQGPPTSEYSLFREVDDVAFDIQGDIYIGYLDGHVSKLGHEGNLLRSWGGRGDLPGQFKGPAHCIDLDAAGNVYVVDIGNRRIQEFNGDGQFLKQFTIDVPAPPGARLPNGEVPSGPGFKPPWPVVTLCITPEPEQFLYVADAFPGRIYKMNLEGRILGMFGVAGKKPGELRVINKILCPSENELYVTGLGAGSLSMQKLELRPTN
jgi:hypothetical protein